MSEANVEGQQAFQTVDAHASNVSEAEITAAFSHPAPYANKILVTGQPYGIRLSFLEITPETLAPQFRAAVAISNGDLISLHQLLGSIVSTMAMVRPDDASKE